MSGAKFTKGEWTILPIEEDKEYIRIRGTVLGDKYKIANVVDETSHHNGEAWCECERKVSMANAHLIAAAPEMYAMLEALANRYPCSSHIQDPIIKLLAKARGEL